MRIRQPCVERPERHFDAERKGEREEEPELCAWRNRQHAGTQRFSQHSIIKGANARGILVNEIERDNADQHQERSDRGVDEELHGRIDASLAAPDTDEEEHRDERSFKEQIKEQQIERDEDADHG